MSCDIWAWIALCLTLLCTNVTTYVQVLSGAFRLLLKPCPEYFCELVTEIERRKRYYNFAHLLSVALTMMHHRRLSSLTLENLSVSIHTEYFL